MKKLVYIILERLGLNRVIHKGILKLKYFKLWLILTFSSKFKRYQKNDPKTYPIIIISFNQLEYIKKLIQFLQASGYKNIIIIDNNSKYPPLIKYLRELEKDLIVHRLKYNYGHKVFWKITRFYKLYGRGYYAVTDADILPNSDCPKDFMHQFKLVLDSNPEYTKVGFSLNLNDIPFYNPHRDKILKWESKFWKTKDENGNFIADIDTTFALYRPNFFFEIKNRFYKAIRLKPPYSARHGGWDIDPSNLTEEQTFYMESVNSSSSWRIDAEGELIDSKYLT
ncbi:glycosyltransferase [Christiangramia echinicola]|uniref:glycosyltransferase n=1 Tax=Christiangramia echinicola TaxID=279359 RepID=UPI0004091A02|nr:glycosyltransferase [Christiangramia echinicola]